jgi:hypothetical protein
VKDLLAAMYVQHLPKEATEHVQKVAHMYVKSMFEDSNAEQEADWRLRITNKITLTEPNEKKQPAFSNDCQHLPCRQENDHLFGSLLLNAGIQLNIFPTHETLLNKLNNLSSRRHGQ